ncbi:MAG: TetR/AcrR family transcriptional regulator [Thermoleophilaceae bacterium]|nr:TetR/AcrR family transcriptional regulator [Thermoleophilaceae bacterium]
MVTAQDTRQAILDAALVAFGEKGFGATTIGDVRARSGTSTGSIYHWFGSKEGIAGALYVEGLREYQTGVTAILERERDAELGVRALLEHHVLWVRDNPDLARFLLSRREIELLPESEEELADMNRELFALTSKWFRAKPALVDLPPDVLHAALLGPAQEWSRHWLGGRARSGVARTAALLGDLAWKALRKDDS